MTDAVARLTAALSRSYRIERQLGQGGMATVYLAQDLKHQRSVAVKVLRPELAAVIGAERFVVEIKTTAALQHPHILPLFDSGTADGFLYYVMPFIDGETLRSKLDRETQLGIDEAVRITVAVADALDYAHRQGVIHRDIKPENILLHDGRPMVADFGIALALSAAAGGRMTETGMSLGTPHYMSPEQATAEKEITARSDIYSLGSVLYEMLTGNPPHTGASAQQIIMKIVTEEAAPVTKLRKAVPPNVAAAVAQSLEKLPADRFATAKEFADALGNATFQGRAFGPTGTALRPGTGRPGSRWWQAPSFLVAGAVALLFVGLFVRERFRPAPAAVAARFAVRLTPDVVTNVTGQALALSPDGSRLVYVGGGPNGNALYTRTLDQLTETLLPGTSNALSPFFSADGQQVAFWSGSRLMRITLSGGPAAVIAEVGNSFWGGTWNAGDSILFATERGLWIVPANGGDPVRIAAADSNSRISFRWPEFLPGGRTALFGIYDGAADQLAAITIATGKIDRFAVTGSNPRYVDQGYVVVGLIDQASGTVTSGNLMAVPFDARHLKPLGAAILVADSVQVGVNSRTAKAGISRNGTIALASGGVGLGTLIAVSRPGVVRDLGSPPRFYQTPRLSPDGRRIAVQVIDAGNDIWLYGLKEKTLTRLTFDRSAIRPSWTPDGRRVVYQRRGAITEDLGWILADGSAPAETLLASPSQDTPGEFTRDGQRMVFRQQEPGGRRTLSVLTLDSARTVTPFASTTFESYAPTLSPDGRWVAYVSDESGRNEVYVRPFPGGGGKYQISTEGGNEPKWSPTGREIFFKNGNQVLAAPVTEGATFTRGAVHPLFTTRSFAGINYATYDVSRDGNTFIMQQPLVQNDQTVVVLLNWFDHLTHR
ncbi:MAG: protein kinase [Gemmatimonadota bacterium]|nr:protein kinase [Gemmatimonadota bacterium]